MRTYRPGFMSAIQGLVNFLYIDRYIPIVYRYKLDRPPSLTKACLESISENYSFWCLDQNQSSSQAELITPFQVIGVGMIQELLDILRQKKKWKGIDITLLFLDNLRRLNLNRLPISESEIRILSIKCQELRQLSLVGVTAVPPTALCDLLRNLPYLESLQLGETNADGSVLKTIADNCLNLLQLGLQGCKKLFNSDVLLLCNQSITPNLRKLMLSKGKISVNTAVDLLKSHRELESLGDCEWIGEAIEKMYGKEVPQTPILNLSDITIYCHEGYKALRLIVLCCPYLTKLTIDHRSKGHTPIPSLSRLTHLKEFAATGCWWQILDGVQNRFFCANVVPMMEKIGENLTSLSLCAISEVCVIRIGQLCPNLKSLDLEQLTMGGNSVHCPKDQYFRQLQVLKLSRFLKDPIPAETLSMILGNAIAMKEMVFIAVESLTDNIILEANEKHSFRFLKIAEFSDCHSVSKETGILLSKPGNQLERLQVNI